MMNQSIEFSNFIFWHGKTKNLTKISERLIEKQKKCESKIFSCQNTKLELSIDGLIIYMCVAFNFNKSKSVAWAHF